jgi:site-specific recombinase XerD
MTEPRLHLVSQNSASLFAPYVDSWTIALQAAKKSPATIDGYTLTVALFARWLDDTEGTLDPTELEPPRGTALIRGFLAAQLATNKPATARSRWVGLKSFCKFLTEEREVTTNPMQNIEPPTVPETPVDMLTLEQAAALIKGCDGPLLVDRRDVALMNFFPDTGCRLGGVAGLMLDDVSLRDREARVVEKGTKERIVPFGVQTARALDRYIRLRSRQPYAHLPNLWLSGKDGKAMTKNAIQQMFRRRGRAILGIDNCHPHMMRHTWADTLLKDPEMKEGDVQVLGGWESRQMLGRYGRKHRAERARAAYQGHSPIDRM